MAVTIYHNPRCSKSRETLALIEARGVAPKVVLYLETPPTQAAIKALAKKLGLKSVRGMMRVKEDVYKDLDLAAETKEAALIAAMVEHPVLIERPIVVSGDRAAIGRPPEAVLAIL